MLSRGGHSFWWIGPIVVGIHLAAHLALTADLRGETVFLVYAAVLGLILDSTLSFTPVVRLAVIGRILQPASWENILSLCMSAGNLQSD